MLFRSDEGLLEGINELNEESLEIVTGMLQCLHESNGNLLQLFKDYIYQQNVSIGEENMVMELIDSKDFYGVLKKVGITNGECKNLSQFLCIDKEYSNIFLVKKIMKLLEYVAMKIEQQHDDTGKF